MSQIVVLIWVGLVTVLWVGIVAGIWALVSANRGYSRDVSQTPANE